METRSETPVETGRRRAHDSSKVTFLAGVPGALPAEIETAAMAQLRREAHARMRGNGLCTVELECRMESTCETCAYFKTGPEFVSVLLRQRDHARDSGQNERAACSTAFSIESAKSLL